MNPWRCSLRALLCLPLLLAGCAPVVNPAGSQLPAASTATPTTSATSAAPDTSAPALPEPEELRGMWVSYIELNTLLSGTTPEQASAALDTLMDNCAAYGMNAVIFHVRANSDAYYTSDYFSPAAAAEPLLAAGFDPLAYAVTAAHKRGLRLHAWVNPFRVGRDPAKAVCADTFVSGDITYYIPSSAAVQALILNGVRELVTRYDIDGVQFDDYFYPASVSAEAPEPFEQEAFAAYQAAGGTGQVTDWRRLHVDSLLTSVCSIVHRRAGCMFGISPACDVQKNANSYYADLLTWMGSSGYVDYICPQLYVGLANEYAPFQQVLEEWAAYPRDPSVRLYIGLAVYKIGLSPDTYAGTGAAEWAQHSDRLASMVRLARESGQVSGLLFYSYAYFDAAAPRSLADGQVYDQSVAKQELRGLLEELA